mmetsp:Transcript_311/g.1051  ORF Transcript_311/g.1051 Transcript_311/m.1051 type:complete len:246 (-) Transcript_311:1031-1768(-)
MPVLPQLALPGLRDRGRVTGQRLQRRGRGGRHHLVAVENLEDERLVQLREAVGLEDEVEVARVRHEDQRAAAEPAASVAVREREGLRDVLHGHRADQRPLAEALQVQHGEAVRYGDHVEGEVLILHRPVVRVDKVQEQGELLLRDVLQRQAQLVLLAELRGEERPEVGRPTREDALVRGQLQVAHGAVAVAHDHEAHVGAGLVGHEGAHVALQERRALFRRRLGVREVQERAAAQRLAVRGAIQD